MRGQEKQLPLREKYPLADWVLNQENVQVGDTVAYFCEKEKKEIRAEVKSIPQGGMRQYISCQRIDCDKPEVVNFYSTVVYRVQNEKVCTCGAKFTSNPKFHLSYCDKTDLFRPE